MLHTIRHSRSAEDRSPLNASRAIESGEEEIIGAPSFEPGGNPRSSSATPGKTQGL